MESMEIYEFFKSILQINERVLWSGAPGEGKKISYQIVTIPFSIIWTSLALLWEFMAFKSGQIIMVLFGLPFVFIGLFVLIGPAIKEAKNKGKIAYCVTNLRLIVREGDDIKSFAPDDLPEMKLHINKNGTGTISFDRDVSTRNGNGIKRICTLWNLSDYSQAQSAIVTMLSRRA